MQKKVFISYRRNDTAPAAGRLCDRLRSVIGAPNVFLDVDTIKGGEDYLSKIENELVKSDTVLVMMGPKWLEAQGGGSARIWNDNDTVRSEICTALKRGCHVIPVLVENTQMADPALLPADTRPLTTRNALPLRHDSFDADADQIMRTALGLEGSRRLWEDRGKISVKIGFAALGALAALMLLVLAAVAHFYIFRQPVERTLGGAVVTQALLLGAAGLGAIAGLRYEERQRKRRLQKHA